MPPVGAGAFTTDTLTHHSAPPTSIAEYTQIASINPGDKRSWDTFLIAYLSCLGESRPEVQIITRLPADIEAHRWIGDSIYDCEPLGPFRTCQRTRKASGALESISGASTVSRALFTRSLCSYFSYLGVVRTHSHPLLDRRSPNLAGTARDS